MNYKLWLRQINKSDLGADCPWIHDEEDYLMYVTAFTYDIDNLEIVENAYERDNTVFIKLVEGATIEQLVLACRPICQEFWDKLRATGFEKIV